MTSEEKRKKLAKWILEIDESVLNEVEIIYNKKHKKPTSKIVAYTTNGEALTKEMYIKHVTDVSKSIENGAKTYTSNEVMEYVLNRKNN